MSRVDHSFKEAFGAITSKTFLEQAKWFLNGFYEEMEPNAEFIWKCVQSMNTISKNKAKGSELDEFEAHRFLEHLGETLTVAEMRERLREIDVDFNRQVAMIEYLMQKYGKGVEQTIKAPQGCDSKEEIKQAEGMVAAAQESLDEVNRQLETQRQAIIAQKDAEDASKHAAEEAAQAETKAKRKEEDSKRAAQAASDRAEEARAADDLASRKAQEAIESESYAKGKASEADAAATVAKQAEEASVAAAEEQKKALAELQELEESIAKKKAELEIKAADGPIVSRGRAKAELEQLKSEDPLPLRRAKINQEAAVRRFQKAQQRAADEAAKSTSAANIAASSASIATETRKQSEISKEAASQAAAESEAAAVAAGQAAHSASMAASAAAGAAKAALAAVEEAAEKTREAEEVARVLETSVEACNAKVQEAVDYLQVVKQKPGVGMGEVWFMERELKEKQKYLPQSKQRKI